MGGDSNVFFSADYFRKVMQNAETKATINKIKQQAEDEAIVSMFMLGMKDSEEAETVCRVLGIVVKHGIPLKTFLEVVTEIMDEGLLNDG